MQKGLICIDIDGTLTHVRDSLSAKVSSFLEKLVQDGHSILFVTGRTYHWSLHLLKSLPFAYTLAVLNGSYVCLMPENQTIRRCYLKLDDLKTLIEKVNLDKTGLMICCGPDQGEKSFFLSRFADDTLIFHLQARKMALKENWTAINDVCDIQLESFAAVRLFCYAEDAVRLQKESAFLQSAMMKDSLNDRFCVVSVTHNGASKGSAAKFVSSHLENKGFVIACGDDYNDIPMFEAADVAVVMSTAPKPVQEYADVIAPSAERDGIIDGLQQALKAFT